MAFFVKDYSPPQPPPRPPELRTFEQVRNQLELLDDYSRRKNTLDQSFFTWLVATINQNSNGFGLDIPSAATISPTNFMHVVTGTATVATINVPFGFNGQLALVSRDGFSISAAGNVANAIGAPASSLVTLVWVPSQNKWYVTAVSVPNGSITTAKLASGAASKSSTVIDNTSVSIGTSDTQVATISVNVNAASDLVQLVGLVATTVSGYTASGSVAVTAKMWRGTVASGTSIDAETGFLNASSGATLSGQGAASFAFFDTGVSGTQSYSVSIAAQAGPTMTKTRCVIVLTDFRAQ